MLKIHHQKDEDLLLNRKKYGRRRLRFTIKKMKIYY